LHLLDGQQKSQRERTGRTGFTLLVVYVDESAVDPAVPGRECLDALRERFPDVGEYRAVALEEIYNYGSAVREAASENGVALVDEGRNSMERLQRLLGSLPTSTSRLDLLRLLRHRLLLSLTSANSCDSLLYGDTTTRLAERTLSETAKGRGHSLPWQISDGPSPCGVDILYPLRDLLKKELVTYAGLPEVGFLELCKGYSPTPKYSAAVAGSGRNITIDELMTHYFEGIETTYPSIVANVVQTAGKLTAENGASQSQKCRICGLPGDGGGGGLVLGPKGKREGEGSDLCYGCARSVHGAEAFEWPL
jgi:cytoplasmic tRNA 2-thiolation protein 2